MGKRGKERRLTLVPCTQVAVGGHGIAATATVAGGNGSPGGWLPSVAESPTTVLTPASKLGSSEQGVGELVGEQGQGRMSSSLASSVRGPCSSESEKGRNYRFSAPSKCFAEVEGCVSRALPIGSRFWALSSDPESSDVDAALESESDVGLGDVEDGDAAFMERALAEGFTADEVLRAGEHLLLAPSQEPSSCSKNNRAWGNGYLARKIVDAVAGQSKPKCKPWRGPLPSARRSQPLTIGDKLAEAMASKKRGSSQLKFLEEKEEDGKFAIEEEGAENSEWQVNLGFEAEKLESGIVEEPEAVCMPIFFEFVVPKEGHDG